MKTIRITIERASDGTYGAYSDEVDGIYGMGESVHEVKQDLLNGIETVRILETCPAILKDEYQLVYKFDTESLLNYYKGILSNPAIEKITGINQKQIHHYASGLKKPRPAQKKKIEEGLHRLGRELLSIEL